MAPRGTGPTLRTAYAQGPSVKPFLTPGGSARIAPDGAVLATSCGDDAHLVDAACGTLLATLAGDSEPVTALAWRHVTSRNLGSSLRCRDTPKELCYRRRLALLCSPCVQRCFTSDTPSRYAPLFYLCTQSRRKRRVHRQQKHAVPQVGCQSHRCCSRRRQRWRRQCLHSGGDTHVEAAPIASQ